MGAVIDLVREKGAGSVIIAKGSVELPSLTLDTAATYAWRGIQALAQRKNKEKIMKSCMRIVLLLSIIFITFGAPIALASEATEESLTESLEDLKKDLDAISETAGVLLEQKEEEFKQKLEQYRETLENMVGEMSEESREHIKELAETAKAGLAEGRKAFAMNLSGILDSMQDEINTLMNEAGTMSAEAREKLARQILEMQEKNKDIMQKMEVLKSQGLDSWDDIKKFFFELWNDLKETYDKDLYGPDYEEV